MDRVVHTLLGYVMTLQIRDKRAHDLARTLGARRQISMTEAVIQALEGELRRETEKQPLAVRISRIAASLRAQAGLHRRILTQGEVDAIWGPPS